MNDTNSQSTVGLLNVDAASEQDDRWLSGLMRGWTRAIELRDWNGFKQMLNLDEIYYFGQPTPLEDAVQTLQNQFKNACDIEINQRQIGNKILRDGSRRMSFALDLYWTALPDWQERQEHIVVHAVLRASRATWAAEQIVIDRNLDVDAHAPVARATAPGDIPEPISPQAGQTQPQGHGGPALEAAVDAKALYFVNPDTRQAAAAPSPSHPPAAGKSRHIVYMPVIIDGETLQAILGS